MEQEELPSARIPTATYRLQFNKDFGFRDAAIIVPYLHDLGISDVYASPYLLARKGSLHGYDIVDQNALNPEIGTQEEFESFCATLACHGMGQLLDIVPNHMCIEGNGNRRWFDLLENGPSSVYSDFFDIDWQPVKRELANKVLIPILGNQYGTVLENGELRLSFEEGAFFVSYFEHCFPIIPQTYNVILTHRIGELAERLSHDNEQYQELMSIITAIEHLPSYTEHDPALIDERYREKEVIKRRLCHIHQTNDIIGAFIDENVAIFNGEKGTPQSFDILDDLLRQQVYRLSYWRVATEEINYRRFFDINALAAIRMEYPPVFDETHQLVLEFVRLGKITGLRVDHVDGLYNPTDYLRRLQRACFLQMRLARLQETSTGREEEDILQEYNEMLAASPQFKPFYIIGEKILMKGEQLPEEWPIFGTTGYDFAAALGRIFVDAQNARHFDAVYSRFVRERMNYGSIVYEKKKQVMEVAMASEVNTLGHLLNTISEMNRHTRDFTLNSLIKALVEVIAFFPVYRTYINSRKVSANDRQFIEHAVAKARRKNPAVSESIFTFLEDVLLLRFHESTGGKEQEEWLNLVMKFQQISGPVMAKGLEDAAFYVYNRLLSLNEVGGAPEWFGTTIEAFHGKNSERAQRQPHSLLTTSTHDTKRSEDVRARINVLSEIPGTWQTLLARWSRMNRPHRVMVEGVPAPDRNEEYLLYQTLVGAWPLEGISAENHQDFVYRIREYMLKAMREAKVNTSWLSPEAAYEEAVLLFIDKVLRSSPRNPFPADLENHLRLTVRCGMFNSLSQTILKITSPGIPDFYQGTELWDFSLVDPDNRRPVDYGRRIAALEGLRRAELEAGPLPLVQELMASMEDGRVKLYLAWKALTYRREERRLFEEGKYIPLKVEGEKAENVCAFIRSSDEIMVIVVVPRYFTRLIDRPDEVPHGAGVWRDTRLTLPLEAAKIVYRNALTGERFAIMAREGKAELSLAEVLANFPVALLEGKVEG